MLVPRGLAVKAITKEIVKEGKEQLKEESKYSIILMEIINLLEISEKGKMSYLMEMEFN